MKDEKRIESSSDKKMKRLSEDDVLVEADNKHIPQTPTWSNLKVLVTNRNNLLEYGLWSINHVAAIETIHSYYSVSPIVGNRYVFRLQTDSRLSLTNVFYFDIRGPWLCNQIQGPSLIGNTCPPTFIVMGSKLFVFFSSFSIQFGWKFSGDVLDTASESWVWCPLPPFPGLPNHLSHLPSPQDRPYPCRSTLYDIKAFDIISYVVHDPSSTLYISLCERSDRAKKGLFALSYDVIGENWGSVSDKALPFDGEGKFVDDICYGFPCDGYDGGHLSCYKLVSELADGEDHFSFVELSRYKLVTGSLEPFYTMADTRSFFNMYGNVFAIIRAGGSRPHCYYCDSGRFTEVLDIDVLQLLAQPKSENNDDNQHKLEEIVVEHGSSQLLHHSSHVINNDIERGCYDASVVDCYTGCY